MPFPMSPAQAAILGQRAAPVAQVNVPMAGGFPVSPAQAAILGQPPAAPTASSPGTMPVPAAEAFSPNPMADMLLERANRDTPMHTGVGLLGRLAAQGVGSHLKRQNMREARAAALDYVDTLPEELQPMARLAVLTGDTDQIFAMARERAGRQFEAAEGDKDRAARQAETTATLQSRENIAAEDRAVTERVQRWREQNDADKINVMRGELQEQIRSNQADENLARDELEFDKAQAEAEALLDGGVELNETQGKALSLVAQMAPAAELLDGPDLAAYLPTQAAVNLVGSLSSDGDSLSAFFTRLMKSSGYAELGEQDKRYISHGLTFADMALRDRTGAAATSGEVAREFIRLLNQPGDTPRLIEEKAEARATAMDGLIAKLPPGALDRLAEISARE